MSWLVKFGGLSVSALIIGCDGSAHVTEERMVGVYHGTYFEGREKFELRANGAFSQEFTDKDGVLFVNSGRWRIDKDGGIVFKPFADRLLGGKTVDLGVAVIASGGDTIIFADDFHYFVSRHVGEVAEKSGSSGNN